MNSVELRQLAYFDAVVRHGGFTRAAEQLHVAQPAISAQIRRLERELGAELLERSTRRMSLTQAGELFLERARQVLAQLAVARSDLDELAAVERGRVRIGATEVLGSFDLPAALAGFRRRHPGVALTLRSGLVGDLLADLDDGEVDVVLGPVHADLLPRYLARPLVGESLVLVTPPGHRLTAGRSAGLAAASDEAFVCLPAGSGLRAILVAAAAAVGFVPRIEFETYSPASIRALVSAGLGVALLAASTAQEAGPPVEIHRLVPALPHPVIGVITPQNRPSRPATDALCAYLRAGQTAERLPEG
jgi:LysR family transcriptional activator of glutamate synthase operon